MDTLKLYYNVVLSTPTCNKYMDTRVCIYIYKGKQLVDCAPFSVINNDNEKECTGILLNNDKGMCNDVSKVLCLVSYVGLLM